MNKKLLSMIRTILLTALFVALAVISPLCAGTTLANDDKPNSERGEDGYAAYFDIAPRRTQVRAGESVTIDLFSRYNYTYYIGKATSKSTFAEVNWKSGSSKPVLHIGADEQPNKSVYFYFYVDDEKALACVNDIEIYACVEVYVLPASAQTAATYAQQQAAAAAAKAAASNVAVPLKGGKNGTLSLTRDDTVAMLYDAKGTAMASLSLSDGTGHMPTLTLAAPVDQNGAKYLTVNTTNKKATAVKISESDKAVMTKNGYAGVCLNGTCRNW